MSSLEFLNDKAWDYPFFKKLAANDTGQAPGHQAGMVIPQDLRCFFPALTGQPSRENPTIEHHIRAILSLDARPVDTVTTRYQIQSWGGTRSPETRLTGNLGSLRDEAKADDFLVIQRSIDNLNLYRLSLIRQNTTLYQPFSGLVGGRRWGLVGKQPPVTQDDMTQAEGEQVGKQQEPFEMFDTETRITETYTKRAARSLAFRKIVKTLYNYNCCVCGTGLKSPLGQFEVEAAHIVPRHRTGSDDARNGLALCKRHHWAFDYGLFAVDNRLQIVVPATVRRISQNNVLAALHGGQIVRPADGDLSPSLLALEWHRENILVQ